MSNEAKQLCKLCGFDLGQLSFGEVHNCITEQAKPDTQWHFQSRGEFPDKFGDIELVTRIGKRVIETFDEGRLRYWEQRGLWNDIQAFRYCDPLPPIPTAENKGYETTNPCDAGWYYFFPSGSSTYVIGEARYDGGELVWFCRGQGVKFSEINGRFEKVEEPK